MAGEALKVPGNYRISVAGAARPIFSILAETHARTRKTSQNVKQISSDKFYTSFLHNADKFKSPEYVKQKMLNSSGT